MSKCYLTILTVAFLYCAQSAYAQEKNCKPFEELTVTQVIKPDETGNTFTLKLEFDDQKLPEYAIFLITPGDEKSRVLKDRKKEFEGLIAGSYSAYIVDKTGCTKHLGIKVK